MAFVIFAVVAVAWSLFVIRSIFTRRRLPLLPSAMVLVAAAVSIVLDARSIHLALAAPRSTLIIHVARQDDWWQLDYERDGVAFTTANELHVPAGTAVVAGTRFVGYGSGDDDVPPWLAHNPSGGRAAGAIRGVAAQ